MQRSPILMSDLASSASDGTSYSCKGVVVSSYLQEDNPGKRGKKATGIS